MPPDESPVARDIRASGWRQGSFVRAAETQGILANAVDHIDFPGDVQIRLAVVTQDCDLVAQAEVEPFVELIGGTEVRSPDALCQNGRNPRQLHIQSMGPRNATSWLEFSIHDRFRIRKDALLALTPDETLQLSGPDVQLLSRWIAKRYTRPAFPDEFNERLRSVDKRLEKLMKGQTAQPVTGIFLDVVDQELPDGEPYAIAVRITAKESAYDDERLRGLLDDFEDRLSSIIDACDGVVIADDDIRHMPEEDLTLAELRRFKRLDKDYRSLPERDGVEQPVDPASER